MMKKTRTKLAQLVMVCMICTAWGCSAQPRGAGGASQMGSHEVRKEDLIGSIRLTDDKTCFDISPEAFYEKMSVMMADLNALQEMRAFDAADYDMLRKTLDWDTVIELEDGEAILLQCDETRNLIKAVGYDTSKNPDGAGAGNFLGMFGAMLDLEEYDARKMILELQEGILGDEQSFNPLHRSNPRQTYSDLTIGVDASVGKQEDGSANLVDVYRILVFYPTEQSETK